MRRTFCTLAVLAFATTSFSPTFAQGPQANKASSNAASGAVVPLTKSAGALQRPSGDTSVSNAPIKSSRPGAAPIDVASDPCPTDAVAATCLTVAKK